MSFNVTIVIPFFNEFKKLNCLLKDLSSWTAIPSNVIIVNTGRDHLILDQMIFSELDELNIQLTIIDSPSAFPGKARNIGFAYAKTNFIACVDAQTRPNYDWLESGFNSIKHPDCDIVWGRTIFEASTFLEKIIKISTYGNFPLQTVPGSIFKASILQRVGFFLEDVRAGEDGDWIKRVQAHQIKDDLNSALISYSGLKGITMNAIVRKWYRNYYSSAHLQYIKSHIDIYFYFISVALIILAFNWNALSYDSVIDGWNMNSAVYIPNITKIMILIIFSSYILLRAIILPIKKGSSKSFLLKPHYILGIFLVSIIIDFTKLFAFIRSRLNLLVKKLAR